MTTQEDKRDILARSYDNATTCSDHPDCVPWKMADVSEVLHAWVRLNNGNFGTVTEWGEGDA